MICDIIEEYKNEPCNNDNDDNVMCVCACGLISLVDHFSFKTHDI